MHTLGAVETRGTGILPVVGDVLGTVVASRAGEAGGLTKEGVVGASRTGQWEAGAPGAEVALGTEASILQEACRGRKLHEMKKHIFTHTRHPKSLRTAPHRCIAI